MKDRQTGTQTDIQTDEETLVRKSHTKESTGSRISWREKEERRVSRQRRKVK